jgi:uracil-DNA glycosylase family 4
MVSTCSNVRESKAIMPAPKMNTRLQLVVRNADCSACRMCSQAAGSDVCVTGTGSHTASLMVVQKMPWGDRQLKEMTTYLDRAGIDTDDVVFTSATKCRTWEMTPNRTDIKECRTYLDQEIAYVKPEMILCLGNEALLSVAGKSGITKHRGMTYDAHSVGHPEVPVIATISPSAVYRNPGQKGGFEADLSYLANVMRGADVFTEHKPKEYRIAWTREDLVALRDDLRIAHGVAFDIESTGFDEFKPESRIVCIAFTLWGADDKSPQVTWALPLYHPESPWRLVWKKVLAQFAALCSTRAKRVAHNGKFDCRWLHQFGWKIDQTFDTMLAAHLLDENRPKGLKPLGRQLLGAPPWGIDTHDLLNTPLDEVLEYCGLDTFNTARLYFVLRKDLLKKENKRKALLFKRLVIPASNEFIYTERAGVWVDREALMTNWKISRDELQAIDDQLKQYVPEDHPYIVRYKNGELKTDGINFNASNFLRWLLFEHLGLPIVSRGKTKDKGDPGAPSVAEDVMFALESSHPIVPLLLERAKWQKYCSAFFSSYAEQLDSESRIHTTFKVSGTVTGRLSSGKADTEKVTSRAQIRGVNLQQVPRDSMVRGIFGAPPGSTFVEFDYSQVELRIAAYIAREQTMLQLYSQGADIHMAMAMRMTGKPEADISKHERKMAKAVNFGFLYGMGPTKFISTALSNYQVVVNLEQAQAARTAFFAQFPGLMPWHAKQRALAKKYKRVETPLGRVRHLPDIDSPDQGVRAEAERQAINSPVQGLASDLALLSFVLVSKQFRDLGFNAHPIGTVHDAVNYEIPNGELAMCLPIIKDTMENLPLRRLFGMDLDVPIIADCKVGSRWGGAQELTADQVYNFDLSMVS